MTYPGEVQSLEVLGEEEGEGGGGGGGWGGVLNTGFKVFFDLKCTAGGAIHTSESMIKGTLP